MNAQDLFATYDLIFDALARKQTSVPSKCIDELFRRYTPLPEDAGKSANLDLAVHRYYAALGSTPHDDMATGLAKLCETQALEGFYNRRPGGMRQLRHAPAD